MLIFHFILINLSIDQCIDWIVPQVEATKGRLLCPGPISDFEQNFWRMSSVRRHRPLLSSIVSSPSWAQYWQRFSIHDPAPAELLNPLSFWHCSTRRAHLVATAAEDPEDCSCGIDEKGILSWRKRVWRGFGIGAFDIALYRVRPENTTQEMEER